MEISDETYGSRWNHILGRLKATPIGSMYGIFTYIWLTFVVNVGKYSIHGASGTYITQSPSSGIYIHSPTWISRINFQCNLLPLGMSLAP